MAGKIVGYVVSVVGIGVMAVGFNMIPVDLEIFNIVPMKYIAGIGMAMVGIGVAVSLMGDKGKKRGKKGGGEDEVPIYEGVGRSRRVVGYRKE